MADVEGDGDGRNSPTFQSRYEKSLGLLTTKFVSLLQSSSGGVLDLKKVHTTDKCCPPPLLAVFTCVE